MLKFLRVKNSLDWEKFFQFPRLLYRQDPLWTPLPTEGERQIFDPQLNPILKHVEYECFIALDNDRPVGRIAAVTDRYLQDQRVGLFGCFETIDNKNVAQGLFEAAAESLVQRGKSIVQGPATLNTSQQVGLLVEGYKLPPQFMMPYNPPYYVKYLEENGFQALLDLYSYLWKSNASSKLKKLAAVSKRASRIPGLRLRPIRLSDPWNEGKRLANLHNETMTQQWGFVPMEEEEAAQYLLGLKGFADPDLLMFCEVDNKPIGVLLMIPDIGPQIRAARFSRFPMFFPLFSRTHSVRVGVMSVVPEYRSRGVAALLIKYAMDTVMRKGYRQAELSLIMDSNNNMNSIITNTVGCRIHKRYRIYQKQL